MFLQFLNQRNIIVFEAVTNIREGSAKGMKFCIFITTRDSSKDHIVRCEVRKLSIMAYFMIQINSIWNLAKIQLSLGFGNYIVNTLVFFVISFLKQKFYFLDGTWVCPVVERPGTGLVPGETRSEKRA